MQAEVSLKFTELSVDAKANFGDDRVADMTGKPEFGDMVAHDINLADWTTASQNLRLGIQAANGGNQAQKDALIPLEKKWDKEGKKVARYVTIKALEKDTIDDQIAVINVAGFSHTKVVRTPGGAPGETQNFHASPVSNVSGRAKIKSDSLGLGITYVTIFHKDSNLLDQVTFSNNEVTLPPSTEPFKLHITTDSRETEVELTSGIKWHGLRFGVNGKGKGPNSSKVSVIPQ
jgi:hypothetical protein